MKSATVNVIESNATSPTLEAKEEQKIEVSMDDFLDYKRLKSEEDSKLKKIRKEIQDYELKYPSSVLLKVPESKREVVILSAKEELWKLEMEKAKQELVNINSPLSSVKITTLKINYRNYYRQSVDVRVRLSLINENKTIVDKDGKTVYKYELLFLLDKFEAEMEEMRKELSLYGLNEKEVLDGVHGK